MIKKDEKTFLGINLSDAKKANYIARIFALFYEKLLEPCLETKGFTSMGRPTIYDEKRGTSRKTYDYTLKNKKTGKYFIAEAKCYLAWKSFEYLKLTEKPLNRLLNDYGSQDNFTFFCKKIGTKNNPYKRYTYKYKSKDGELRHFKKLSGKILIWPKLEKVEIKKIKKRYGFSDIFSIEDAINEIKHKSVQGEIYREQVLKYKRWTEELFKALLKNEK